MYMVLYCIYKMFNIERVSCIHWINKLICTYTLSNTSESINEFTPIAPESKADNEGRNLQVAELSRSSNKVLTWNVQWSNKDWYFKTQFSRPENIIKFD